MQAEGEARFSKRRALGQVGSKKRGLLTSPTDYTDSCFPLRP